MEITLNLSIEKIDNGFVIRDRNRNCAVHTPYDFGIARVVEHMVSDAARAVEDAVVAAEKIASESRAPMQQDEAAHPPSGLVLDPDEIRWPASAVDVGA